MAVGRSGLTHLRQSGATRLLFPRVADDWPTSVLLNTSGGVTGGDRFSLKAEAAEGARLTVTTQAAERIYRANGVTAGTVRTDIAIGKSARVDWLPQETIVFDGAHLRRKLSVDMAEDARLLAVEPLVFGRQAMGEKLHQIDLTDRIEIRRGGDLVFADATRLSGDVSTQLADAAIAGGAGAMASVIFVAPEAEVHLDSIRAALPETGGASLIRPGILFARILARDSFVLRASLIPILESLSQTDLPRTWML